MEPKSLAITFNVLRWAAVVLFVCPAATTTCTPQQNSTNVTHSPSTGCPSVPPTSAPPEEKKKEGLSDGTFWYVFGATVAALVAAFAMCLWHKCKKKGSAVSTESTQRAPGQRVAAGGVQSTATPRSSGTRSAGSGKSCVEVFESILSFGCLVQKEKPNSSKKAKARSSSAAAKRQRNAAGGREATSAVGSINSAERQESIPTSEPASCWSRLCCCCCSSSRRRTANNTDDAPLLPPDTLATHSAFLGAADEELLEIRAGHGDATAAANAAWDDATFTAAPEQKQRDAVVRGSPGELPRRTRIMIDEDL